MARTYAQLTTAGLIDQDWLDLPPLPQWLYIVLLRQPKLTMWGTGDFLPRRWVTAHGVTAADVNVWLNVLEVADYVHVDRATDEFVIRSFTRHDLRVASLSAPVVKGMWNAWVAIASPRIRALTVSVIPSEAWAKLEATAPAEAVHIRRSPPFEWEAVLPFEWQGRSPFECPSTSHQPPSTCWHESPSQMATGLLGNASSDSAVAR